MASAGETGLLWPAIDLMAAARLWRSRQASAREMLEAHLERISLLDEVLHACITVMASDARNAAKAADAGGTDRADTSLLTGLPLCLKDNFNTAGVRTTAASLALATNVPNVDAAAVDLLRRAGAVVVAKTNMDELAIGGPFGSQVGGIMVNPWDAESIPGGSSGGSAIAVAASMCMAAIGSDTGGSIRNPAAWCGVAGFKPTQGAIPIDGVIPVSWSLDTAGWLAHTVADCAVLFAETSHGLAGRRLPEKQAFIERAITPPRRPLRLGIVQHAIDMCETKVRGPLNAAVKSLQELGVIDEARVPSLDDALLVMMTIAFSEASSAWDAVLRDGWQLLGAEVRTTLDAGRTFPAVDYIDAQRIRTAMRRAVDLLFEHQDVLLMPSLGSAPRPDAFAGSAPGPNHPDAHLGGKMTCLWNLTGNPVISLPCGFTDVGRPVSVQLIGARGRDGFLLQIAAAVEAACDIPWPSLEPLWAREQVAAARTPHSGIQESNQ